MIAAKRKRRDPWLWSLAAAWTITFGWSLATGDPNSFWPILPIVVWCIVAVFAVLIKITAR